MWYVSWLGGDLCKDSCGGVNNDKLKLTHKMQDLMGTRVVDQGYISEVEVTDRRVRVIVSLSRLYAV